MYKKTPTIIVHKEYQKKSLSDMFLGNNYDKDLLDCANMFFDDMEGLTQEDKHEVIQFQIFKFGVNYGERFIDDVFKLYEKLNRQKKLQEIFSEDFRMAKIDNMNAE